MKFLIFAAAAVGTARAGAPPVDNVPVHTVYNCEQVRQDVDVLNEQIGDGACNPEANCGPFSYDLGDCWADADEVCEGDSWYHTGRNNFRCSTNTGGIRIGRAGNNDGGAPAATPFTTPCACYTECLAIAEQEGVELVAFDKYSGKCRCWSGVCDAEDGNSLPCRNGEGLSGNDPRCPSEIYVPDKKFDCDGNDITFRFPNLEGYIGDGFCDDRSTANQEAVPARDRFNLNCEAFNYDGGDCAVDCHQSLYWATDFVDLNRPKYRINECTQGQPLAQTEFTTACDCYTFCAEAVGDATADFLFDHDHAGHCRCFAQLGAWRSGTVSARATVQPACGHHPRRAYGELRCVSGRSRETATLLSSFQCCDRPGFASLVLPLATAT
jgi:hypothetical protein